VSLDAHPVKAVDQMLEFAAQNLCRKFKWLFR
jgi:hypothetical protein